MTIPKRAKQKPPTPHHIWALVFAPLGEVLRTIDNPSPLYRKAHPAENDQKWVRYIPASGSAEAKLRVAVRALRVIAKGGTWTDLDAERAGDALARIEKMGRKP